MEKGKKVEPLKSANGANERDQVAHRWAWWTRGANGLLLANGDIFMSLIHTCQLNGINPFDYLMNLEKNAGAVRENPTAWLPWHYPKANPTETG